MSRIYTPVPGTIPFKVVKYLGHPDVASWISNADLAEAVGCDSSSLAQAMGPALKHGAVVRRRRTDDRRMCEWSLGDGTPLPDTRDQEDEQEQEARKPAPKGAPKGVANSVFALAGDDFRAGLFSDGTMVLHLAGQQIELAGHQVAKLRLLLEGGA